MSGESTKLHATLLYISAAACLILYIWGHVLFTRTIVPWWIPAGGALAVSAATAAFMCRSWGRLTGTGRPLCNALWHFYAISAIGYFAILGCNYFMADASGAHKEEVVAVHKIRKVRDTYRRVGRNRMVKSGTRIVYRMEVAFADGTRKKIHAAKRDYDRTREGGRMTLTMQRGILGFPVIKE